MKLKLTDKAFGMRVWKWYILVAAWMAPPTIHLIRGEFARAFELSLYMLLGVMLGRLAWYTHMWVKNRKCKGLINAYYTGKSTHDDGKVLYTRIPIVMPERSFGFQLKCARNSEEIASLLVKNLLEMHRLEPHLILFLKSWEDDGEGFPPWASKEEKECIIMERAND